jgi:uncharacterized Zn finger protein (UPF0148 family)
MKLAWQNLLQNNCPKCGDPLGFSPQDDRYICSVFCGKMFKRTTVERIVARLNKEEYQEEKTDVFEDSPEIMDQLGSVTIQDYQDEE